MDILFPRDDPEPSKTIFTFVLRFKPNFKPESQIVIRRSANKVEVFEYTSLDGNIYHTLNVMVARTGREDAINMAKRIRVKRQAISVPYSQVKQWYATFFDSLATTNKPLREKGEEFDKKGSESFILHGTSYELWYIQSLNKVSFTLYDIDIDDARYGGEFPLVQWMDTVRREVEKSKP